MCKVIKVTSNLTLVTGTQEVTLETGLWSTRLQHVNKTQCFQKSMWFNIIIYELATRHKYTRWLCQQIECKHGYGELQELHYGDLSAIVNTV